MGEFSITAERMTNLRTSRAILCALGAICQERQVLVPLAKMVHINQKIVQYTPADKLMDAFLAMLCGARTLFASNTTLRPDRAVSLAFGRDGCAEQSTIWETIQACSETNLAELRLALHDIFQTHSQTARHVSEHFVAGRLELELDLSGLPAGKRAEASTKGYFSKELQAHGRQLVRIFAAKCREIVWQEVVAGNTASCTTLQSSVELTEQLLGLTPADRQRVRGRLDAGFGTFENICWLLHRGYQVLGKLYSPAPATQLASSVRQWDRVSGHPGRECGLVTEPLDYGVTTTQVAVRYPLKKGGYSYAVLITTDAVSDPCALADEYDGRTIMESGLSGDKGGLGLEKRRCRSLAAQQVLVMLAELAHNLLTWAGRWLGSLVQQVASLGIRRLMSEILPIAGVTRWRGQRLLQIRLNGRHPFAPLLRQALARLLGPPGISVSLGKS